MKIRIYYMAEVERETLKEAQEDVLLHPNLLQYFESQIVEENEEEYDPLRVDIDIRRDFDIFLELNKIDEKDFKHIDVPTIQCVYENRTTKGIIYTGRDMDSKYEFIFYFPFKIKDVKIVKVLSTPNISFTESVVGKFISEDMAKQKPDKWDLESQA